MSGYIYIKEISGNECIGNSLSTINANFINLNNNLQDVVEIINDPPAPIPFATTLSAGIVRIGQGLTINNAGVLSNNTLYTFTNGLISSTDHVISVNVDNISITVEDEMLKVLPSQQDAWVVSNSSSLNEIIANTKNQITSLSSTVLSTSNTMHTLSSEYNYNMHVTLNSVNSLVNLLSAKIKTQPVGGVVNETVPYVLSVSASPLNVDFLPMTYKWYFNSQLINNTNTNVLSTHNAGRYYCVCSNAISQSRSVDVYVDFNRSVNFLDQPDSQTYTGTQIQLMVAVSGTRPYTYQWFRNSEIINGANELYYFTSLSGDYVCVVSNMVNSVTSEIATITI
jgi:hypothetical protein